MRFPLVEPARATWLNRVRRLAGIRLARAMPGRVRALREGGRGADTGFVDRWIATALRQQIENDSSAGGNDGLEGLLPLHHRLWSGATARGFHERSESFHADWWQANHAALVEPLTAALERLGMGPSRPWRLVEIGCGSGLVTADLATRIHTRAGLAGLLGLDLSTRQMQANRQRFAALAPRVTFADADATEWVHAHHRPRTAYLTNGGVLEYFSSKALAALLAHTARHGPCAWALAEPVAADFDPAETTARSYGTEGSLAHPYPWLFQQAGWRLEWQAEQRFAGVRWWLGVATRR